MEDFKAFIGILCEYFFIYGSSIVSCRIFIIFCGKLGNNFIKNLKTR